MKLFVFGLGYSAEAVVRRMRPASVVGTTRSADKADRLAGLARMVLFPSEASSDLPLEGTTHLLVSIAPGEGAVGSDPVLAACADRLAEARGLSSIVYLSTVGVYGDHDGAWVDETADCKPGNNRSAARLAAENAWRAFARRAGVPLAILRLSGIYGPGRNALASLAAGTARRLIKPGQVFNRVHVDDIAAAVDLAFRHKADGVFNITDDEPAPPQDVVAFAAALMGVAPPPEQAFASAELTPMARSFYGENKRVANALGKRVLGLEYAYPDYRAGLTALWRDGRWR